MSSSGWYSGSERGCNSMISYSSPALGTVKSYVTAPVSRALESESADDGFHADAAITEAASGRKLVKRGAEPPIMYVAG